MLVDPDGREDYNYDDITNNSWKKFDIDNDRIVLNEIVVTAQKLQPGGIPQYGSGSEQIMILRSARNSDNPVDMSGYAMDFTPFRFLKGYNSTDLTVTIPTVISTWVLDARIVTDCYDFPDKDGIIHTYRSWTWQFKKYKKTDEVINGRGNIDPGDHSYLKGDTMDMYIEKIFNNCRIDTIHMKK